MASPPSVQTGHVPHPATPVVQGHSWSGVYPKRPTLNNTTGEDHLVIQGNAAGSPVKNILNSKLFMNELGLGLGGLGTKSFVPGLDSL